MMLWHARTCRSFTSTQRNPCGSRCLQEGSQMRGVTRFTCTMGALMSVYFDCGAGNAFWCVITLAPNLLGCDNT